MAKAQDIPKVSSGTIERIEDFNSNFIDNRRIDIWLPENYSKEKKYAVLYMQDGQMLFDPTTTWNKQAWEIDKKITQLTSDKKIAIYSISFYIIFNFRFGNFFFKDGRTKGMK